MTEKQFVIKNERTIIDNKTGRNGYVFSWKSDAEEICDRLNWLVEENEQLKEDNMLLIEDSEKYRKISIQFDNRNKELVSENEQLKSELEKVVEVCRKYGIYKEELQYVLADYDKMLNENGERAIRYKYCVNSR